MLVFFSALHNVSERLTLQRTPNSETSTYSFYAYPPQHIFKKEMYITLQFLGVSFLWMSIKTHTIAVIGLRKFFVEKASKNCQLF